MLLPLCLGFCIDVSEDRDIREIYPELAEQRGHPAQRKTPKQVSEHRPETEYSKNKSFKIKNAMACCGFKV